MDVEKFVEGFEEWYDARKNDLTVEQKAELLHDVVIAEKVLSQIAKELKEQFVEYDDGEYDYGDVVLVVKERERKFYDFAKLKKLDLPDDVFKVSKLKVVQVFKKSL